MYDRFERATRREHRDLRCDVVTRPRYVSHPCCEGIVKQPPSQFMAVINFLGY